MRILLLEDDEETAAALCRGFRRCGMDVERAASCPQALALISDARFDVVVLDLMVPGGSGYDVLGRIRETGDGVPVLILTARDEVADRVEGLDRGADDYLVKPFAFAELLARVRAIIRRPARRMETLRLDGGVEIDPVHRTVVVGERRVEMTRVEFAMLWTLGEQRGNAVTRRDLLAAVWGYRFDPGTNVVDVHVARLRRKLEAFGATRTIRTVRGVGYAVD
jgi:two-component system copper resistance phosphate regulon response regulator CusR